MSFRQYIIAPPLALAVSLAPPPKPREKPMEKDKEKKEDKPADKDKIEDKLPDKDKKDVKPDEKLRQGNQAAVEQGLIKGQEVQKDKSASPADAKTPESPAPPSPASMIPEPPTPASAVAPLPNAGGPDIPLVPSPNVASTKDDTAKVPTTETSKAKDEPLGEEKPLLPLKLLGPAPDRPVRTKLDLDPARPYPPINTDPRGAYYKYAKAIRDERIFIDVTKDGWLTEQWRELPEREALARLRGETEKQKEREIEAEKSRINRKVPKTSEEILLQLWNDLVEAPHNEVATYAFWNRYDWSDPEAQAHLVPARPPTEKSDKDKQGEEKKDKDAKEENADIKEQDPNAPGWTCEGLEAVLAAVGVQCTYKTEKPLPRHWTEPAGAYLVLGHDFFMLRTDDTLQWKPETAANQFEILRTTSNDRIFGDMVKAQQAEERKKKEQAYRERKLTERKKAEEEARKAKAKEAEGEKVEKKDKDESNGKAKGVSDDAEMKKQEEKPKQSGSDTPGADTIEAPPPATPTSIVKVKDGEEIKPPENAAVIATKGEEAMVAVPVEDKVKDRDEKTKHEVEVVAVAPGQAVENNDEAKLENGKVNDKVKDEKEVKPTDAQEGKDLKGDKEGKNGQDKAAKPKEAKRPFDRMHEAELLAKMIKASGGGPDGPVTMDDIKLAFKALEMATESGALNTHSDPTAKKDPGPLIWTWNDACERWRWKNYELGLHNITSGGWEERDWKEFADDRGYDEFEEDESWAELQEIDVHDWSC